MAADRIDPHLHALRKHVQDCHNRVGQAMEDHRKGASPDVVTKASRDLQDAHHEVKRHLSGLCAKDFQ